MKIFVLWCAALLFMVGPLQAQELDLRTDPVAPVASQSFSILAMGGGCHAFLNLDPLDRELTIEGGVIRVVVPYVHTGVCVIPPLLHQWTVSGVPAGNYVLELHGEDPDDSSRHLLDAIDIVVVPGVVASVPTLVPATSPWALFVMVSTILAITVQRRRFI